MIPPAPIVISPAEIAALLDGAARPPLPAAFTRARPAEWSLAARADDASLYLYDAIGWPGIEPREIVEAIRAIGPRPLTVHLNSPGGDVFAGLAIFNTLRQHPARVDVRIEGLAGSIASVVAMAGTSVTMARASLLMIHEPRALALGTSHDMRHMAGLLDKAAGIMADVYAARGAERERVRALMHAETWFTAESALDAGLITAIDDAPIPEAARAASAHFETSGFATAPTRPPAPTPASSPRPPARAREHARTVARSFALLAGLPAPKE